MADAATIDARKLSLSGSAVERVRVLIDMEGKPGLMLRVSVSGGGCSGFQYGISLDDTLNADDRVFDEAGVKLVVDETSLELLNGSVVDYVEELVGSSFQIRNPNASGTCGCGSSFSV